MGELKKMVVTVPSGLLSEIDTMAMAEGRNRSEFVREAMHFYLKRKAQADMCSKLKEGYIRMGQVNLQLAQEAEADENYMLEKYELILAECEDVGD